MNKIFKSIAFDGMVSTDHPLNPLQRMQELGALGRALVHYPVEDLWERDTRSLPPVLARLRRQCRSFAEQHMLPRVAVLDTHVPCGSLHPQASTLLSLAGRSGLMSNLLPAPFGSATLSIMRFPPAYRFVIQVEELSRICAGQMLLLSAHQLGLAPICLSGDSRAIWRYFRPMAKDFQEGKAHLFAYAITEPSAGSDAEDGFGASTNRPRLVAQPCAGGYRLSGEKCFISGGDVAQKLCVFAALEQEGFASWTCFVVDAHNPGLERVRTETKMGMRASSAAQLHFTQAFVPHSAVIGGLRQGWALNRATLNASRYPVAAMAVGLARRACELTIEFCLKHATGGRPLLNYQEYQLQLAQMIAETRAIRFLVWQQAAAGMQPRQAEASLSKFYATDRAQTVIEMGMDIMAEYATDPQYGMEKLWRDVRLTRIFEGTNEINRLSVIEDIQPLLLQRLAGTCSELSC